MKIPKNIKKFCPIEVVWIDSMAATEKVWYTETQYEDWIVEQYFYKQIGFFLETKNDSVSLCSGFSAIKSGKIHQICGINTIPIGCIKSVKLLK